MFAAYALFIGLSFIAFGTMPFFFYAAAVICFLCYLPFLRRRLLFLSNKRYQRHITYRTISFSFFIFRIAHAHRRVHTACPVFGLRSLDRSGSGAQKVEYRY